MLYPDTQGFFFRFLLGGGRVPPLRGEDKRGGGQLSQYYKNEYFRFKVELGNDRGLEEVDAKWGK